MQALPRLPVRPRLGVDEALADGRRERERESGDG
jgi:hypothetical protein